MHSYNRILLLTDNGSRISILVSFVCFVCNAPLVTGTIVTGARKLNAFSGKNRISGCAEPRMVNNARLFAALSSEFVLYLLRSFRNPVSGTQIFMRREVMK